MPQHGPEDYSDHNTGSDTADSDINSNAIRPNAPFWYSFDYGSVHFTVISTENSVEPGSRQYAWLEADLAAVDR